MKSENEKLKMKTEKQKMLSGELYLANDPELTEEHQRAFRLIRLYNATTETELEERQKLLKELFGKVGKNAVITPPFYCDYGSHIYAGDNFYMNFG